MGNAFEPEVRRACERDRVDGEGRILIDPNAWSADGATALAEWTPSEDGKLVTYAVQDGGTDWRTVRVIDVATGKILPDELKWLKFGGGVDWAKDGSGFYYSRFPEPAAGQTFQASSRNQKVYFHKLGTAQAADRLIYATPANPDYGHGATISEDGRWLVITTSVGTDDRYEVTLIDLKKKGAKPRTLIKGFDNNYSYVGNEGQTFFFVTNDGAPKLKLVSLDVRQPRPVAHTVIAEDAATLEGVSLIGSDFLSVNPRPSKRIASGLSATIVRPCRSLTTSCSVLGSMCTTTAAVRKPPGSGCTATLRCRTAREILPECRHIRGNAIWRRSSSAYRSRTR